MPTARKVPIEVLAALRVAHRKYGQLTPRESTAQPVIEEPEEQRLERERCLASFSHFLRYWRFVNRESGRVMSFEQLWPGQAEAAAVMEREPWVFLLKAGKLGFTQLETAFDAWVALRQPNARVHLFSRDFDAAKDLLGYVRFGLSRLPDWLRLPILDNEAGGNTTRSLKILGGPDDVRTIVSYATKAGIAIDQTASHAHVDELSHMQDPEGVWGSVSTTVAPGGSLHIVTRGAGRDVYTAELWESCSNNGGDSRLYGHFAPWDARPDRTREDRDRLKATMPLQALLYYLPETAEDALAGDDSKQYIPMPAWDACYDSALPALEIGSREPVVIALDAAVSGDCAAAVAATRHPQRHDDPAIRSVRVWRPQDYPDHRIPLAKLDEFVRECCRDWNVVQVAYDPYQLESIAQQLRTDGVVWAEPFQQGGERLIADADLVQATLQRRLVHNGDPILREHIGNAVAKIPKGEDTKLRIEKRSLASKVDAAVAASMAVRRVLALNL